MLLTALLRDPGCLPDRRPLCAVEGNHSADYHCGRPRRGLCCALGCETSTPPAQRLGDVALRRRNRVMRSPRARAAGRERAWVWGSRRAARDGAGFSITGAWSIKAIRRRRPPQGGQASACSRTEHTACKRRRYPLWLLRFAPFSACVRNAEARVDRLAWPVRGRELQSRTSVTPSFLGSS